ncbi:uncharacterized protein LOC111519166 [Drosophila willistoni]|uniref:uncharacterized protein LOC111519166 n=1 Tax=Drosophila willistoni TaxID=7260 RepID=UPI000C26D7C3|nr:uncharacterized protein LOC111519166 [Drosophila willistoni]
MAIENILGFPDECLMMVFRHLNMRDQCNFAYTCWRFQCIYQMIHKNHYRHFVWYERTNRWSELEIQSFFKLNGYKMQMLSLTDFRDHNMERLLTEGTEQGKAEHGDQEEGTEAKSQNVIKPSKTIYVAHICGYLKNLRSLILTIDHNSREIIIEICRHMRQLQDLTISIIKHPNYELLALLPNLRNLDIEYFEMESDDKIFKTLSKLRPHTMQTLRIGTELKTKQLRYICQLSNINMLNIYNANSVALEYLLKMKNLTILSLTDSIRLDNIDFMRLLCGLKTLSTLYVSYCQCLSNEFVFFAIKYLEQEMCSLRRLPFCLECHRCGVVADINQYPLVKSALSIIHINFKNKPYD